MIFQAVLNKKKPVLAWKIFFVCVRRELAESKRFYFL